MPDQIWQRFDADLSSAFNLIPKTARQYWVDNLMSRTLSVITGYNSASDKYVPISVSSEGQLDVTVQGTIYNQVYHAVATLATSIQNVMTLPFTASRVEITAKAPGINLWQNYGGNPDVYFGFLVYDRPFVIESYTDQLKFTGLTGFFAGVVRVTAYR